MANELAANVEKFIAEHIPSLEALEVLLVLGEQPRRGWTVDELYRRVLSNPHSIRERLQEFEQQGLVSGVAEPQPVFKLKEPSPERDTLLKDLAVAYKQRRHRVIEIVYAKPASGVQAFADAFKLRKK